MTKVCHVTINIKTLIKKLFKIIKRFGIRFLVLKFQFNISVSLKLCISIYGTIL